MDGGGAYRNWLPEARRRIAKKCQKLDQQIAELPLDQLSPGIRHDLARLRDELLTPISSPQLAERADRLVLEYEQTVELALTYTDHRARERRVGRRKGVRVAAVAVPLVLLCGMGVTSSLVEAQARASRQACRPACFYEGRCEASWVDVVLGLDEPRCVMTTTEDCSRSCAYIGACHREERRCVARTLDDCQGSVACAEQGYCTPLEGRCHVASDADCAKSQVCRDEGACTLRDSCCVPDPAAFENDPFGAVDVDVLCGSLPVPP